MTTTRINPLMPQPSPRVALVLSPFKVVINKGTVNDIKMGQTFLIYSIGDEINDPETSASLGRLEIVKGRGKVVYLQEQVAHVASIEVTSSRIRRTNALSVLVEGISETVEDAPFNGVAVGDICRPI